MSLRITGWEDKRAEIVAGFEGVNDTDANVSNLLYTFGVTCMVVGLQGVTESNIDQFLARANFVERVDQTQFMNNDKGPVYWSKDNLTPFIGVSANVANETKAAWLRRTTQYMGL